MPKKPKSNFGAGSGYAEEQKTFLSYRATAKGYALLSAPNSNAVPQAGSWTDDTLSDSLCVVLFGKKPELKASGTQSFCHAEF